MQTSFSSMIFLRRANSAFISLTFSSRSLTCKLALVCSSTCMVSITSISEILRLSIIESEVGAFLSLTSVGSSAYAFGGFFFEAGFSFDVSLDFCGFFDLLSPFFNFGFLFSAPSLPSPSFVFLFSRKVQIKHSVSPLIFSIFPPSQAA